MAVQQRIAASIFDVNLRVRTAVLVSWAVLAAVLAFGPMAPAQTLTVLHGFTFGADGGYPIGGLTQDTAGALVRQKWRLVRRGSRTRYRPRPPQPGAGWRHEARSR